MKLFLFKSLVFVLALPCGAGAAYAADPSGEGISPPGDYKHSKLGLWEETIGSTSGTSPQMPAGAMDLSGMSPDERARVEAVLKRQREQAKAQGGAPRVSTRTKQFCVRQSDIDQGGGSLFRDKQLDKKDGCTTKETARTSSRVSIRSECVVHDANMVTEINYEVRSPTEFAATMSSSGSYQGQPMKSSNTMSAHWIGADCGNVK